MEKNFVELFHLALKDSHDTFEKTMDGVTEEVAHYQPEGKAIPIGAAYAHTVLSEDLLVNMMITKKQPLIEKWGGKIGLSKPHPSMSAKTWSEDYAKWVKDVQIDLSKLKEYAQEVYKQSDEIFNGLTDKDLLKRKVDLSMWGMGNWSLGHFILSFLISHVNSLCGEISSIKGVQGLKGYPF